VNIVGAEPDPTEPSTPEPAVTASPSSTEPAGTEAPASTEPPSTEPAGTEVPASTEPPSTEPPSTEPPSSEPPATTLASPPTTDTFVPSGIALSCDVDGDTVSCSWSGGVVPGFAKFLLLRGDGTKGRVPYMTADPSATSYVDTGLAPGSYSYVVVSVDANSKALVHSNPVHVQIAAPA
jgi:hypothetical protein